MLSSLTSQSNSSSLMTTVEREKYVCLMTEKDCLEEAEIERKHCSETLQHVTVSRTPRSDVHNEINVAKHSRKQRLGEREISR